MVTGAVPPANAARFEHREFDDLRACLGECAATRTRGSYLVPEILLGGDRPQQLVDVGAPHAFFVRVMDEIRRQFEEGSSDVRAASLHADHLVYQCFIRTFASLNGEVGTALKQIAFLPFLRNRLGATVLISLPTGVMGKVNRKGTRGSPFAVCNPFDVDPSLGDRLVPSLSAITQYKALVQACLMMGLTPGSVVPLCTLAIDSPLFAIFPELGYWWSAPPEELLYGELCRQGAEAHTVEPGAPAPKLPQLPRGVRARFFRAPPPEAVAAAVFGGQGCLQAQVPHGGRKKTLVLANSFPDVVAGDASSYTWQDVSTVNYLGTVHPSPLGLPANGQPDPSQTAWQVMPLAVAWRACELGEQVFLVDVGASVPSAVLSTARRMIENWPVVSPLVRAVSKAESGHIAGSDLRREFRSRLSRAVGGEDDTPRHTSSGVGVVFFIAEELWSFDCPNEEMDAVTGPLIFCVGAHSRNPAVLVESLRYHLRLLEDLRGPRLFVAGTSNHDTAPVLPEISPLLSVLFHLLPGGVPLVFSGSEFHSQIITNKEFGFNTSPELRAQEREFTESTLGLFGDHPIDWSALPVVDGHGRKVIDMVTLLRWLRRLRRALTAHGARGYRFLGAPAGRERAECLGICRFNPTCPTDAIVALVNLGAGRVEVNAWDHAPGRVVLSLHNQVLPDCMVPGRHWELGPHSAVAVATGSWSDIGERHEQG